MKRRLYELISPLMGWHVLGVAWVAQLLLVATMVSFRAVKASGIAQMLQFDDVPLLRLLDIYYPAVYWGAAGLGLVLLVTCGLVCRRLCGGGWAILNGRGDWRGGNARICRGTLAAMAAVLGLALVTNRYATSADSSGCDLTGTTLTDWLLVASVAAAGWLLTALVSDWSERTGPPATAAADRPVSPAFRLGMVYLLGFASVFVYGVLAHRRFWDPAANGGYDYRPFFETHGLGTANLVLWSTSALFASIAAVAGCVAWVVFRAMSRAGRRTGLAMAPVDCRRQAVVLAMLWAMAACVPWEVKLLPEIQAENGWIMPATLLVYTVAGLAPLLLTSCLMIRRDLEQAWRDREAGEDNARVMPPQRSEFALWTLLLFPLYPYLRWLRPPWARAQYWTLTLLSAVVVAGLTWSVNKLDVWFDFDDWRGMLKAGQFPFMQVFFSVLAAFWVYVTGERLYWTVWRWRARNREGETRRPGPATLALRTAVLVTAAGCIVLASWPFWGWGSVSKDVFARAVEFNNRHEFEIRFLHWLIDFDRDGYAAALHGADPDDFDDQIQAGGIGPPKTAAIPIDEFAVTDSDKARAFPNLVIFYLEGVTPASISAFGQRRLPGGVKATPAMDSVAADGTAFTQARCFYPSTWDAWFAVNSGRFLRIEEMDCATPFRDRYSRYNNLYKTLKLAGINRWCHADTAPYYDLFVPGVLEANERTTWQRDGEFDSTVSTEEDELDVWRGDKRAQRMLDFLDSLEPGDRFFMCEHMSDTHFPWRRTSVARTAELGLGTELPEYKPDLAFYEKDADLPCGGRDLKYSCYFQTVTRMDAQIMRVLNKLKQLGLYDKTMIVIVSDHGCQWWEHEHIYYVAHLYEQSLHVPLIVKAPGIDGGVVCDDPVLQLDVLPTVMDLAGVSLANARADYPLTGRSLVPLMKQKASPEQLSQYRNRDLILTTHYDTLGVIRHSRDKLIFDRPTGTFWLFDLVDDPMERHNLVDERPELLEAMLQRLREMVELHPAMIGSIAR